MNFKIWVVNGPRNLMKLHDRRQSDDDNDDDDDDVISKQLSITKKERKFYVCDQPHQFGMEVHNVAHLLCLQH